MSNHLWDYIHDTIAAEVYAENLQGTGWCVGGVAAATNEVVALLQRQGLISEESVPDVEVTYAGSSLHAEASESPPGGRRSGAKNLSAPTYQKAFISEARSVMGQPDAGTAEALVGRTVRLIFNDDKAPVEGLLAHVVSHPTTVYLLLEGDETRYSLNAIQEIRALF